MTEQAFLEELIRGADNAPVREAAGELLRDPLGSRQMLFFWGDQGVGKTWMMKALAGELEQRHPLLRVGYLTSSDLMAKQVWAILHGTLEQFRRDLTGTDVLLVDDISYIAGREATERELCHLLDGMIVSGRRIVLTSRRPPEEFPGEGSPLRQRLVRARSVPVCKPDHAGRVAIARKVAVEMDLPLTEDLLELVAEELDTPWCVSGMVKRIAVMHRLDRISLTRESLEQMMRELPMKRRP